MTILGNPGLCEQISEIVDRASKLMEDDFFHENERPKILFGHGLAWFAVARYLCSRLPAPERIILEKHLREELPKLYSQSEKFGHLGMHRHPMIQDGFVTGLGDILAGKAFGDSIHNNKDNDK